MRCGALFLGVPAEEAAAAALETPSTSQILSIRCRYNGLNYLRIVGFGEGFRVLCGTDVNHGVYEPTSPRPRPRTFMELSGSRWRLVNSVSLRQIGCQLANLRTWI